MLVRFDPGEIGSRAESQLDDLVRGADGLMPAKSKTLARGTARECDRPVRRPSEAERYHRRLSGSDTLRIR